MNKLLFQSMIYENFVCKTDEKIKNFKHLKHCALILISAYKIIIISFHQTDNLKKRHFVVVICKCEIQNSIYHRQNWEAFGWQKKSFPCDRRFSNEMKRIKYSFFLPSPSIPSLADNGTVELFEPFIMAEIKIDGYLFVMSQKRFVFHAYLLLLFSSFYFIVKWMPVNQVDLSFRNCLALGWEFLDDIDLS